MKTKDTKNKKIKNFDAVGFMREVRDKLSKELANMTSEQILEYFRKLRTEERILPSI
ncbi:MAG: hypothetical protein V1904_11860 [Bacteroidota bacterium]